MSFLRDIYHSTSFRGRLLLLLIVVSLVQAGIAAYTFRSLQEKPVDERVRAQLNANLRAAAPVIDGELKQSAHRIAELRSNPDLITAITGNDTVTANALLAGSSSTSPAATGTTGAGSTSTATTDTAGAPSPGGLGATTATGDATSTATATAADATSTATGSGDDVPEAYVTGPDGRVIAGRKPEGILLEQDGTTNSRIVQPDDGSLVGTLHVPVALDETFMRDRLGSYTHGKGIVVFVTDGNDMVSAKGTFNAPHRLKDGLSTTKVRGTSDLVLTQGILAGDVRIAAAVPESVIADAKHKSMGSLIGFMFVLVAMTLIESFAISRAVGDALRRFAQLARQLAGGHLDKRIPVVGTDEVAALSTSFNQMAHNLQERIDNLVEARAQMKRQIELFGDALANATEIGEMLQAVCALAMESTGATHARFWTVDEEGHFDHSACVGLRPDDKEPAGVERAVTVQNRTIHLPGTPNWLVVPARTGEQITGLLTLVNVSGEFSEDDRRIAERLGVQAAVALDNARMHEQLRLQATRDGLTGLPNHRSLQDALFKELVQAYTRNMPLGIALLDIDNFKRINDTYGHGIGDEAIKSLARVLDHGIGEMGMAARLGGEEFVVVMPGCDADASVRIADRLREDVTYIEVPLEDGSMLKFTVSIGVANVDQNPEQVDNAEMLHQADTGLYNAKRSGKNKVCLAGPDTKVIEMSEEEKQRLIDREKGTDVPPMAA